MHTMEEQKLHTNWSGHVMRGNGIITTTLEVEGVGEED